MNTLEKPADKPSDKPVATQKYTVVKIANATDIYIGGKRYEPGQQVELTDSQADRLGALVELPSPLNKPVK